MPKIKRIDHVAIVVENIDSALGFWRDALGLKLDHVKDVPAEKSAVAFFSVGGSEIELVQPTTDDSGIAKYLQKRGPGMHHICLEVEDIEAALVELQAEGVQLINESPRLGDCGKKYAFIHPKAACGVLVELYELQTGDG